MARLARMISLTQLGLRCISLPWDMARSTCLTRANTWVELISADQSIGEQELMVFTHHLSVHAGLCKIASIFDTDNTDITGAGKLHLRQMNALTYLLIDTNVVYSSQTEIGQCHAPTFNSGTIRRLRASNSYIVLQEFIHELKVCLSPIHPKPRLAIVLIILMVAEAASTPPITTTK